MKLTCNIEVNCRSSNLPGRRKAQRGCLTIARPSVKKNDLWLLLQTATNQAGTKYKIDQNIERVFTKFVDDGKATIRVKEPPHDLIIQSDVIQLKSFLHILKLGLLKKIDPSVLSVSNMSPKNFMTQKTKVIVKQRSEYPTLEGFPRTTEALYLAKLETKSFDRQILRLQSLRILDLSDNQLSSLPSELGDLPNLTELYLAMNRLEFLPPLKWSWLNGMKIQKNLRLLDIGNNKLSKLPVEIGKLSSLVTLKLGDNELNMIPQSIGNLVGLKYLEIQKNILNSLPGSMINLRLCDVNVTSNPFRCERSPCENTTDGIPRLIEIAARVMINSRIYYDAGTVPFGLTEYLNCARYCACGKAIFNSYVRHVIEMSLHRISGSVTSSGISTVPFDCYFCSAKCVGRYANLRYSRI